MDRVFVKHPISDQTIEQLQKKADDVMPMILEALQSDTPINALDESVAAPEPVEEECGA